ncbi:MAG: hypothetical protein IT307_11605 [Chloroflexi bacterium]|nr:hypothetical protein [Chloroflexota bacterium]
MNEAPPATDPQAVRCATHPDVETYLRCGKCERPICPRCLVQTPVGARCRECAQLRSLPVYDVRPRFLLRGALAALVASIVSAIVLTFVLGSFRFLGFFILFLAPVYGLFVAAAVGRAANEKRGTSLAWVSAGMLVLGFVLGRAFLTFWLLPGAGSVTTRLIIAVQEATSRADLFTLGLVFIAALFLYNRLR